MTLGVTVQTRLAPPSLGNFAETDTLFLVGQAGTGSTTAASAELHSTDDFASVYSAGGVSAPRESGNQDAYDYLDTFFREGGKRAYFARYTTDEATALALFPKGLGPGQVAATGTSTQGATLYGKLRDHAVANNRVALLDVGNGDTVAAMTTKGAALPDTPNGDYVGIFGPWVNIPAPAGTIGGAARQVPASAVIAALCARVDADGNPNRAAAGRDYPLQYVTSYVTDIGDADREALLNAGVNTLARVFGVLENYGFQSLVNQSQDNPYWQLNVARLRMWLVAQAAIIGEGYMFKPIDGKGKLLEAFKGALTGPFLDAYGVDALYGLTPDAAFSINVSASVNPVAGIAQGQMTAVAEFIPTPHSKSIVVQLVTVPVTGQVQ